VDADTVAWGTFLHEAQLRFERAGIEGAESDARRIIEEVGGYRDAEGRASRPFESLLTELATERGVAAFDRMVARRLTGEPLQYVLRSWAFRTLDLFVDGRVLIPRPETEQVVEAALHALDRTVGSGASARSATVVDLGTGSGAIALAIATERPRTEVWATDASARALQVASANLAGAGRVATRIRLAVGDWFDALPPELLSSVDLIVANPPYIGESETLPASVVDWEPAEALRGGPTGTEQLARVIDDAPKWLRPGGHLVMEMAPAQVEPMTCRCADVGLTDVATVVDLAGLNRAIVAAMPRAQPDPSSFGPPPSGRGFDSPASGA